ncbi:MAG: type IX secretion system sortase PorU [Bacteroidota bacterium]
MKTRIAFLLLVTINIVAFGQSKISDNRTSSMYHINWQTPASIKVSETKTNHYLFFTDASYSESDGILPRYSKRVKLANGQNFNVDLENANYQNLTDAEAALINDSKFIGNSITIKSTVSVIRKQSIGTVSFIPLRKNPLTGKIEKLVSFNLSIKPYVSEKSGGRSVHTYASHSVLQTGKWYKIAIANDGIYKIDYSFLHNLGIDMTTLNPDNIRIYGNGGGMLSELNSVARPDDLLENAITVHNAITGVFGSNDYVLFYGKGPNTWSYNNAKVPKFQHTLNLYSDSAYYFITTDLGSGKRIQSQPSSSQALNPLNNSVWSFDDYGFHELDATNFIKSGRQWFGEYFDNIAAYNFSFAFPNIDATSTATVKANIASRNMSGSSLFTLTCQSATSGHTIPSTSGDPYVYVGTDTITFMPSSSPILTVNVTKQTPDAVGWLDYIEVNARRQLTMVGSGDQMIFRDSKSMGTGNVAQFNVTSSQPIQIWDITDPSNVALQSTTITGNQTQFVLPTDNLKQFIAFTGGSYFTPSKVGEVVNQDLHSLSNKDFIIITHPNFYDAAVQLASFHETRDSIYSNIVTPQQIYNEFSSGAQDVTAIRDFLKMFYDRAGSNVNQIPKYLLLFGDGSYDNKQRFSNNTNFIPTYESTNSTLLTGSYVSDDFYGCLDDSEGAMVDGVDAVDIGIGRFPIQSKTDAQNAINKIFSYKKVGVAPTTSTVNSCSSLSAGSPFGDWRNVVCFIADDEDGDLHLDQANSMATYVHDSVSEYNIDKIYFDAYVQEATPGGDRYPGASDAITKRVEKGCLIMNYTGHGGEVGIAHERVVEVSQINSWKNINNMPLFFTATCELSRYDDPERISAGEYMFLNPTGAGIALFTTVRESYAGPNFGLNSSFYHAAFNPINGKMPRLGDLYQIIKDLPDGCSLNGRNFTLLGDPALTLNYPKYDVSTDSIFSHPVSSSISDTLKALSTVTISGYVRNKSNAILSNYNGVIYPTVYDKAQNITTLSNDGTAANQSPPRTFQLQKSVLFKGKVSVTNGHFRFTFIVPKDIAYNYGMGRISYYAENGNEDANGYYDKAGICCITNNHANDVTGPDAKLYLNDTKFVFGGMTNESPDLYTILKDESGINTVGNGIGHDLTAILDGNTANSIILNDYYQSDLNSYKSGSVRYPFSSLAEGNHTLKLKVWDVYNNSSETYTEFIVSKSAELALNHVLNYPNPFTTHTQFYFEENQCCQVLDVQIQIFTISGKIVKTIDKFVTAEGFRSEPIDWDGRDDFGDKIGRGVYIYRLKVKTSVGSTAEKFEKLVILN